MGATALDNGVVALERGGNALLRERRSSRVRGASAACGAARKLAVRRSRSLKCVGGPPRAGAEQDAASVLGAGAHARAGAATNAPQACGCKACMCEPVRRPERPSRTPQAWWGPGPSAVRPPRRTAQAATQARTRLATQTRAAREAEQRHAGEERGAATVPVPLEKSGARRARPAHCAAHCAARVCSLDACCAYRTGH